MADVSRDNYRGLLVMDPRLESTDALWGAQSSYNEASPQPGTPVPSGDYEMVLQATGSQAQSSDLNVQVIRGGMPGADKTNGARFVWKNQADASTAWRGCDVPTVITQWEALEYIDGGGQPVLTANPYALTLDDGTVVVCYDEQRSGDADVRVAYRNPSTGVWTKVNVDLGSGTQSDIGPAPCMVLLPSGRIVLLHYVEDTTQSEFNIRMYYSDDDGATWTMGQDYCLDTSISSGAGAFGGGNAGYQTRRLRAAYNNGTILLIVSTSLYDTTKTEQDILHQYVSTDGGCNFAFVDRTADTVVGDNGAYHDIRALPGGGFQLYFIATDDISLRAYSFAHAFEKISDKTPSDDLLPLHTLGAKTGNRLTDGECAAVTDDDGTFYVLVRYGNVDGECLILRPDPNEHISVSGFTTLGQSSTGATESTWWNFGNTSATTYPTHFCATAQRGRLLVFHNWAASPGNEDDSLGVIYLGGYSTVTMPGYQDFPTDADDGRASFEVTWLPFDLPDGPTGTIWTLTSAGTPTVALESPGQMDILTDGGTDHNYYTANPSGTVAEGMIVYAQLQQVSGGSLSTDDIAIQLVLDDGAEDYDLSIRFTGTQFRVYDNNAGSAVGTVTVDVATDGVQLILAMDNGNFACWYRLADTDHDRGWTAGPSSTGLTDGGGGAGSNIVRFGHINTANANSHWVQLHYTSDEWAGLGLATAPTNPDDLFGRRFPPAPDAVAMEDGVKIRAVDGPGYRGDTWRISTRHDFAIERIFPAENPSPRVRWRSTDETQKTIGLVFNDQILAAAESEPGCDLIGIALMGINWRTGILQRYDVGTASWVNIATIDAATGMATLEYTRVGATVVPNSPTDTPYLFAGEAKNWHFHLGSGIGGPEVRKVLAHAEGKWDDSYSGRVLKLHLDNMTGGELASGTGSLWAKDVVILVNLAGETAAGLRLVIDAQNTADGYFEIGNIVAGPAYIFGYDYSWGRTLRTNRGFQRRELPDRTTRRKKHAPAQRIAEFAWNEGVDVSQVYGTDPDHIVGSTTSGSEGIASRFGTPLEVEGLATLVRGHPLVYLADVPKSTGAPTDVIHLNRRDQFVYGTLDEDVVLENVQGDERQQPGEVLRVASVRIVEEV